MLGWLILLFTVVPAVELALLLAIGRSIGLWPTLAIILATGILGGLLAKSQGLRVVRRIQEDLAAGRPPAYGLLDGLLILVGGLLLLAPGIITDLLGLVLLVPVTRDLLKHRIRAALENALRRGTLRMIRL